MHYNGPVVRPHTDADSLIVEVTTGCTHNSCTFCNFYEGVKFWIAPLSQVESDLKEAYSQWPYYKNVWAAGGNPFVLSTEQQIERWSLFKKYYPKARLSTYARISDFRNKSVDNIKRIHEAGLDDLMIGMETGDDEVLEFVNKGYTSDEIIEAAAKLDEGGITYRWIYLGGIAGKGKLAESAKKSAAVINQTKAYHMNITTVSVMPGTKLYEQMKSGEWIEPTEKERILETRALLAGITLPMTIDSMTAANNIHFTVDLAKNKDKIIKELDELLSKFTDADEEMLLRRRRSMMTI